MSSSTDAKTFLDPNQKTPFVKRQEEKEDEIAKTIKQIENSIGDMFLSINGLEDTRKKFQESTKLPEEIEYDDLDGSLEDLEEVAGRIEPSEDKVADRPRDLLRLSFKMNGRPATPTLGYSPSVYSEADSGIGVSSPTKRKDFYPKSVQQQWSPEEETSKFLRHSAALRSNRSYNFDNVVHTPKSLRSTNSFNDQGWNMQDNISLRSVTIPMGSSDGKKIIYKQDATAERLLQVP